MTTVQVHTQWEVAEGEPETPGGPQMIVATPKNPSVAPANIAALKATDDWIAAHQKGLVDIEATKDEPEWLAKGDWHVVQEKGTSAYHVVRMAANDGSVPQTFHVAAQHIEGEAYARRIAVCLNACANISTETLAKFDLVLGNAVDGAGHTSSQIKTVLIRDLAEALRLFGEYDVKEAILEGEATAYERGVYDGQKGSVPWPQTSVEYEQGVKKGIAMGLQTAQDIVQKYLNKHNWSGPEVGPMSVLFYELVNELKLAYSNSQTGLLYGTPYSKNDP